MKKILIAVLIATVLVPLAVTVGGVVYLNRDTWKSSYRLSNALRNARSVLFVEFTHGFRPGESGFVLARRTATADDISRFRRATGPWFLPFERRGPLCFEPHHRVEIVREDGTELTFSVCFLCGNFDVFTPDDASAGTEVDSPPSWDKSLRSFFTSIGMAPKTREEYGEIAFNHRQANDREAKAHPQ
jgi:hypothetical protein